MIPGPEPLGAPVPARAPGAPALVPGGQGPVGAAQPGGPAPAPGPARLLRFRDQVPVPWRNGGGTTVELGRFPRGDSAASFSWRVSIATIAADGDFSAYPGYDRILVPLDEAGLDLVIDGHNRHIPGAVAVRFPGESSVRAVRVTEPRQDLNLMVSRDTTVGEIEVLDINGAHGVLLTGDLVVVIAGSLTLDTGESLVPRDAIATLRPARSPLASATGPASPGEDDAGLCFSAKFEVGIAPLKTSSGTARIAIISVRPRNRRP